MNVRQLVLLTLATLPLHACTGLCKPPQKSFAIDTDVSAELAAEMEAQEAGYSISCESVCGNTYSETTTWQVSDVESCELTPASGDAPPHITCQGVAVEYFCKGRRPQGHIEMHATSTGRGGVFAEMAHLEAASVLAFEQLEQQLERWGAPETLRRRCAEAAHDERNHARWISALAHAEGVEVPEPEAEAHDESLLAAAIQNATEGCVFETFAVVVARVWAETTPDPALRALYQRIADDEERHAQLAWDLDAWFQGHLDASEREAVAHARANAMASLPDRAHDLIAATQSIAPVAIDDAKVLASAFAQRAA